MSSHLFSIIIPCNNYGHYLSRALHSILNQTGDDYEVIIIDDGSTDNTAQIVDQLLVSHDKLKYFYQEKKGLSASRNIGITKSNGQYLIFLDADDEFLPDALSLYRQAIKRNPDKQVFIGEHITQDMDGKQRYSRPSKIKTANRMGAFSAYLNHKLSISPGSVAFHHSVFDKLKYPEHLPCAEDLPLNCQVLALFDITLINEPLVRMFKHDDSLRHNYNLSESAGLQVVDTLFNPMILPAEFMTLQPKFYLHRCLSLSRSAYRAGHYSSTQKWYFLAVHFDKRALLKISYLTKFVRSLFKKNISKQ